MLTLFWTGLNVLLLLLILYAWFRVLKILRREIGLGLAVVFMLSLSVRGSNSVSDARPKNLLANERQGQPIGNWSTSTTIPLNFNNRLSLRFEGIRTDSMVRAHGMYSTVSGLMLGHEWKPLAGMANSEKKGVSYSVFLLHEWKMLGVVLYTSSEEYEGVAPVSR